MSRYTEWTNIFGKGYLRLNILLMVLLLVDIIQLAAFWGNKLSEIFNFLVVFSMLVNTIVILIKCIRYYKANSK